ncbi:MAG: hypothetical protein WCK65_12400 [Rhodospirillaceae bacterium]
MFNFLKALTIALGAALLFAIPAIAQSSSPAPALDLAMRVKIVYAEYHQANIAIQQLGTLTGVVSRLGQFALFRYGQGLGTQLGSV